MPKPGDVLRKVREICLALPDTRETDTWGKPHFRVGEKIFCGCDDDGSQATVGFKLEMAHAAAILADPRFTRAPYVGHKGWVNLDAAGVRDWDEVSTLILESYRLIAPKRTVAKLESRSGVSPPQPAARKTTASKPTAKKTRRGKPAS
jgi:predicted DNA-binding protein (MmcQ/YjbR family)